MMCTGVLSPLKVVRASAADSDARRRRSPQIVSPHARPGSKSGHQKSTLKTEAYRGQPVAGGGGGSFYSGGCGNGGGNVPRKITDFSEDGDGDSNRFIARGALMTAVVLGCADFISQVAVERRSTLDFTRMARLAVFGLMIKGPLMAMFYRVLDATFPGTAIRNVASKLLVDQGPFSWTINGMMLFILPLIEGHGFRHAYKRTYDNIVPMQITAYKIWPAVHMVNYAFVPPAARIVFVNTAGLMWSMVCCFLVAAAV